MKKFKNRIRNIITDNKSGSTTILNDTIDAVRDFIRENQDFDKQILVEELKNLYGHHSNFIVLFHFVNTLFSELEKSSENLILFIDNYRNKWETAIDKSCRNFINDIDLSGKSVLLHSNSTAIHKLFAHLGDLKVPVTVYQTFSSPAGEGKVQAEYIGSLGFDVRFIHEDNIDRFVKDIDLAVFGADIISENEFLNKSGTFSLALMLNRIEKPVYILADSRKVLNVRELPEKIISGLITEKEKPAEELWNNPPPNVRPVNYYFGMTPDKLITGFYLENGFITNGTVLGKDFKLSKYW
jgi:translation initiation factor 2B subunit (eIF-2B alpha/beta/delta family)